MVHFECTIHKLYFQLIFYFYCFCTGTSDVLPAVVIVPVNQNVTELEEAVFTCEMKGNPAPDGIWFKENEVRPLQNSSRMRIQRNGQLLQMTIRNVSLGDSGKYTCLAKSSIGRASSDASLTVKSKKSSLLLTFLQSLSYTRHSPHITGIS